MALVVGPDLFGLCTQYQLHRMFALRGLYGLRSLQSPSDRLVHLTSLDGVSAGL
jgi:hypothetical protein